MSRTTELDHITSNPGPWILPIVLSAAVVSHSAVIQPITEPLGAEIMQLASKETLCPAKVW